MRHTQLLSLTGVVAAALVGILVADAVITQLPTAQPDVLCNVVGGCGGVAWGPPSVVGVALALVAPLVLFWALPAEEDEQ